MKFQFFGTVIFLCSTLAAMPSLAAETKVNNTQNTEKSMKLEIPSFAKDAFIPEEYAFCIPATKDHVQSGKNRNPHLKWSNVPAEAKSLAIICVDPNVPSVGDNVNKEGVTVSKDLSRVDFYHWVLVDMPTSLHEIKAGQDANGVTPHGKKPGATDYGVRGINDYTHWFAGDKKMDGQYGGYDGPCPPWNDEVLHHYHFKLFALDVKTLGLQGNFDGKAAVAAMKGHILAESEWVGTYSLNPKVISTVR